MSASQLTPDQAKFLLSSSLPTLKNEHQTTLRVIRAIPLDKADYRPDPVSKTALELAWHIAATEKQLYAGMGAGAFDFTPFQRPETVRNSADIAAWFAETFATNLSKIEQLSGEQLIKSLDFRGAFQMPAVAVIQFALNHSIHHRGQLSTYLRPMGGKVPAIYGDSYDTAQERKAKEAKV